MRRLKYILVLAAVLIYGVQFAEAQQVGRVFSADHRDEEQDGLLGRVGAGLEFGLNSLPVQIDRNIRHFRKSSYWL